MPGEAVSVSRPLQRSTLTVHSNQPVKSESLGRAPGISGFLKFPM